MIKKIFLTYFLCFKLNEVYCAKILGVFPYASLSHQVVFQPIWKELSLKGHSVTVLTPNPLNDPKLINLTEIDLGFAYEIHRKRLPEIDGLSLVEVVKYVYRVMNEISIAQLTHPPVQALIQDKTKSFDVVLVEFIHPTLYALGARFNCPLIGISSMGGLTPAHGAVGNPAHPVLNPDLFLPYSGTLGFFDRLYSTYFTIFYRFYYYYYVLPELDKVARQYISSDIPYLGDIEKNVSMLFLNVNPIIQEVRPNVPAIVEIGGIHMKKRKPLSKELETELDEASKGVVYFSLGSNVRSANLSEEVRGKIIDALSELPYKVFWKWEDDHLPGQPKNVVIQKWFPQNDILGHPNIKVFLTQGGLQSMEEAISNGVPLVGMPFFGDQPLNVRKMVNLGIAQAVDPENFTKEQLKASLIEVAENPKYRNKVLEIGDLISDVPMTGLEKAVWWTEYVIRHKGAKHLRSPAIDMPWYQYLLLDVLSLVLGVILILVFVLYKTIFLSIRLAKRCLSSRKVKAA